MDLSTVCRLSVKRVGLYDEKTAPVSASTNCFVQRNSRKPGPWNYSLTYRPVLTQLLVPKKTTREKGEKFSALNTPTAPQTQDEVQVSANAARLWIRPILLHRQK